jgi:cyclopropane fatty-acyl-phospholipid synthase-like methyltransferase
MNLKADDTYERKYEENYIYHNQTGAGEGSYSEIGAVELQILINNGLNPKSFLMDFGCGLGRLSTFAIDYLNSGNYLGTEISQTAISTLHDRLSESHKNQIYKIILHDAIELTELEEFIKQTKPVDMICAFSVFTHLPNEDTFNILLKLKEMMSNNSVLVASFIEFNNEYGKRIFLEEAEIPYRQRDLRIRNVVSTKETVLEVFKLAGYKNVKWSKFDENISIDLEIAAKYHVKNVLQLGQSVGVFQKIN